MGCGVLWAETVSQTSLVADIDIVEADGVFCRAPAVGMCGVFLSRLDWGDGCGEGTHRREGLFSSHGDQGAGASMALHCDVGLDPLAEAVPARFSSVKLPSSLFPVPFGRKSLLTHPRVGGPAPLP